MSLGRTVAELEHSISEAELREWVEFYNDEPFFADRNELQIAQLLQMLANYLGGKTKVTDFMPSFKEDSKKNSQDLTAQIMAVFGGQL